MFITPAAERKSITVITFLLALLGMAYYHKSGYLWGNIIYVVILFMRIM